MANYYNGNPNYGFQVPQTYQPYQPVQTQMRYPQMNYEPQYVIGIEGANAFQLPPGVQQMILWDSEKDCFYVKKLDDMGRPKIVAWKDFHDHVEEEPISKKRSKQESIDLSAYPTKKDIEDMFKQIDMSQYLTKEDFEKVLGQLCVGEKGRVVRNELDS